MRVLFRLGLFAVTLLGAAATQAANIVVGQVGPLSGAEAHQGRGYAEGMELYFKEVNKTGAGGGHRFTLVRKDDGGRPQDTVALTMRMLEEDKPLVLTGYFGNKNIADLLASGPIQQAKIPVVGYRSWEIRPEMPYLYSVRADLRDEIKKIATHLGTIGITRLGLFYEAGSNAGAMVAAANEAARNSKATIVSQASYEPGTAKTAPASELFLKEQPQAILLVASAAATASFIEQYRLSGGTAQLFTHSGADVEEMATRLSEEQLQGVAIAQVTPNPYKVSSRVAKELNDLLAQAGIRDVPISYAMMDGFIAAKVIVEAVRRQGPTPTRQGTLASLDTFDSFDVGGYVVSFKAGSHTGSHLVELSIVSTAGKIRQ